MMKMAKSLKGLLTAVLAAAVLVGMTAVPANAASLPKESVKYKGYGKVEVELLARVNWYDPEITVEDEKGDVYKAVVVEKDHDEIEFRILNYEQGRTYNFAITGVRAQNENERGTIKGNVTIPETNVSEAEAIDIALKDSANYGVDPAEAEAVDLDIDNERGFKVFKIELNAKKNGYPVEIEYTIDPDSGEILEAEFDD